MEKVLVLAPHETYMLRAISDYSRVSNLSFVIVGSKKIIDEISKKHMLRLKNTEIIDIPGEVEIALFAESYIEKQKIKFIILGDIPSAYHQKIINVQNELVGMVNVVDTLIKDEYIFISSGSKYNHADFEDKKKAVLQASEVMSQLGIKYINASLVYPKKKADNIESKIIKMLIKDLDIKNLNITDYKSLKEIFALKEPDINLIVMKNYDLTKMFIDSLDIFTDSKVCTLLLHNGKIIIDTYESDNYKNLFFSLFIVDKLIEKRVLSKVS